MTYVEADWAPQRTGDWISYAVSATATNLGAASNATAGLRVRVGTAAEVSVRVSRNAASARVGHKLATTFSLTAGKRGLGAAKHSIEMRATRQSTTVVVDGTVIARIPPPTARQHMAVSASPSADRRPRRSSPNCADYE